MDQGDPGATEIRASRQDPESTLATVRAALVDPLRVPSLLGSAGFALVLAALRYFRTGKFDVSDPEIFPMAAAAVVLGSIVGHLGRLIGRRVTRLDRGLLIAKTIALSIAVFWFFAIEGPPTVYVDLPTTSYVSPSETVRSGVVQRAREVVSNHGGDVSVSILYQSGSVHRQRFASELETMLKDAGVKAWAGPEDLVHRRCDAIKHPTV
jgi:hypothetical protein